MAAQSCGAHNGRAAPKCWFVHSGARSCGMHRLLQTFGVRTTMIGTRCSSQKHRTRKAVRFGGSNSAAVGLAGANAHGLVDVEHKYLPVPDLPCGMMSATFRFGPVP